MNTATTKHLNLDITAHARRISLLTVLLACLTACASTAEYNRAPEPTDAEVATLIGCNSEEVALCIETNCEIEEWRCVPRDQVRDMFKAGDFNR